MKTDAFDDGIRKKLAEVSHSAESGEAEALFDRLKQRGMIKPERSGRVKNWLYVMTGFGVMALGSWIIYLHQKNKILEEALHGLKQEIQSIKKTRNNDLIMTPTGPNTEDFSDDSRNTFSVPVANASDEKFRFTTAEKTGVRVSPNLETQSIQSAQKSSDESVFLKGEKQANETQNPEIPGMPVSTDLTDVNMSQDSAFTETHTRAPKSKNVVNKNILLSVLGGSGKQMNVAGVSVGWMVQKKLEVGTGLQLTFSHPEHFRNAHEYSSRKGSEFHHDYKNYVPADTHDIRDIHIENHTMCLPLFLTRHGKIQKNLGWYATAGADLTIRSSQVVDFHGAQLSEEPSRFRAQSPGAVWGFGFLGAGLEGHWRKMQLMAGVQVCTRAETGNASTSTMPTMFSMRLSRSFSW